MAAKATRIEIAKPCLGEAEKRAVLEVLERGQLIHGERVAEFERRFAAAHGARYGVATSNGTTALTAALLAHEIGAGDEVIVPSFSFFATASSVIAAGAIPVFADIDPETFALSVERAEAAISSRTRAVMPVHLFGHPADLPRFASLCARRGLILLEDAAQAHLAAIEGRRVGSYGTTAFSFHPSKNMTTTEGGMVLTNDAGIAERLRMIRNQGRGAEPVHELLGYNFRMTEVAGAIGVAQLARLPELTERRARNARYYDESLVRVRTPTVRAGHRHVFQQYTVRIPEGADRDTALARLDAQGIGARIYYPIPIHRQPAMARRLAELGQSSPALPETERACREVLSLPVHPLLTDAELDRVVAVANSLW
ncbi:MAG: DegT/DnrJ/EryC1/StrS family aminotransferase [Polyangiaceae bacterium]|nr:DegT/DnrJ/EryC1/StrS family aminotransferase [Polyangiaceae bacterium]